jgi:hypothetical protein
MSLETAIQNLADAINKLADASNGETSAEAPKRRGRPRKVVEEVEAPEADEPVTATKVVAAEKQAAKPVPQSPLMPTFPEVKAKLIEVVTKISRNHCTELCQRHGGSKLSELDPSVYPAIYTEATELLQSADV